MAGNPADLSQVSHCHGDDWRGKCLAGVVSRAQQGQNVVSAVRHAGQLWHVSAQVSHLLQTEFDNILSWHLFKVVVAHDHDHVVVVGLLNQVLDSFFIVEKFDVDRVTQTVGYYSSYQVQVFIFTKFQDAAFVLGSESNQDWQFANYVPQSLGRPSSRPAASPCRQWCSRSKRRVR